MPCIKNGDTGISNFNVLWTKCYYTNGPVKCQNLNQKLQKIITFIEIIAGVNKNVRKINSSYFSANDLLSLVMLGRVLVVFLFQVNSNHKRLIYVRS